MPYDGTSNGSMVIPGESAEDYNARLAAWYARKASGDPFPGPQPGYAGSDPTANSANTAVHPDAPGASLSDTQTADDRDRMSGYLQQLQGQAQTGDGAWEQALASHTAQANSVASAVGQSSGLGALTAGQNIGNAQAGNAQREAGQANLLRAQTQQHAQDSLSGVLSGQGAIDAQEAATSAGVKQGVLETNLAARSRANKDLTNYASAAGQGILTAGAAPGKSNGGEIPAYSDGGTVPGQAMVFGDDEANDTVRAKLSPGEIVIPRSITESPHAAQLAAAFVEAVKKQGPSGATHFDGGGAVPSFPATGVDSGPTRLGARAPGDPPSTQEAPSIGNGGLLDTADYNRTRDANLSNSSNFLQRYAGQGPSIAPQAMQNATDSTINDAMQAQRPGAGHEAGAAAGVGAASQQAQGAAGNAAGIVAGESERGGEMFAQAVQRQRAQDLAMATAQQQAAWRNTMLNSGIGLEQQNQLKGLLGGIGQGAVAAAGLFPKDNSTPSYDANLDGGYKLSEADGTGFEPGSPYGDYSVSDGGYAADGGVIVSRQGTRRKAERPGQPRKGNEPRGLNTVTSESNATPDEWVPYEGRREPGGGTQTEDTIQQFAGGGPVFEGVTSSTPQPGPFTPNASSMSIGDALRTLMLASSPGGGPPVARGTQDDPSAARPAAVAPPGMSHGAPARERPFATPGTAQPTQPTAQPMTAPSMPAPARIAQKPVQGGGAVDPFAMEQKAAEQKASVDAQAGDAQAAVLSGLETKLEANAVQQAEVQARASEAAKSQLTAIQAARDEMKAIDVSVDPDRYTARMGWGGKLASIIGLTLGAIGNDNGVNRAASLLNQQIDRDLDAQKSEHELKLRKGQSAVDSAQNAYSLARQATQDDIAANAVARGTMLDLADNQVKLAAAKFASPQAKAALLALSARIAKDRMNSDAVADQRLKDNNIKQQNANSATKQADAALLAAGAKEGGKVLPAETAAGLSEAPVAIRQLDSLGKAFKEKGSGASARVSNLLPDAVGRALGTDVAEYNAQALQVMQSVGKIMEGGKLAAGDEDKYKRMLPKAGDDEKLAKQKIDTAKAFLNDLMESRKRSLAESGYRVPGMEQAAKPAAQQMRLPSGEIVEVR